MATIKFDEIEGYVDKELRRKTLPAISRIFGAAVNKTPVKKGNLIGNYQVGSPKGPTTELKERGTRSSQKIKITKRIEHALQQYRLGDGIEMVNNAVYADKINKSHGMTRAAAREAKRAIK